MRASKLFVWSDRRQESCYTLPLASCRNGHWKVWVLRAHRAFFHYERRFLTTAAQLFKIPGKGSGKNHSSGPALKKMRAATTSRSLPSALRRN